MKILKKTLAVVLSVLTLSSAGISGAFAMNRDDLNGRSVEDRELERDVRDERARRAQEVHVSGDRQVPPPGVQFALQYVGLPNQWIGNFSDDFAEPVKQGASEFLGLNLNQVNIVSRLFICRVRNRYFFVRRQIIPFYTFDRGALTIYINEGTSLTNQSIYFVLLDVVLSRAFPDMWQGQRNFLTNQLYTLYRDRHDRHDRHDDPGIPVEFFRELQQPVAGEYQWRQTLGRLHDLQAAPRRTLNSIKNFIIDLARVYGMNNTIRNITN